MNDERRPERWQDVEELRDAGIDVSTTLNSHRSGRASEIVEAGAVRIDLARHLVTLGGEAVYLTPREFALLLELARNADRVVTHQSLLRTM